jgi:hypothetical protein
MYWINWNAVSIEMPLNYLSLYGRNTKGANKCLALKKTTSYGIKKMYLLYIFTAELRTFMTSLF